MGRLLKVVVTGPESSGKSVLAKALARHFDAAYVPEFARIYLEKEGPDYNYELVQKLSRLHLQHQQRYLEKAAGLAFLDTDLINYLVWQNLVYGKHDPWLDKKIAEETDHRYLITAPDIPWEADPLRENPKNRKRIFKAHLHEVEHRNRDYRIIEGSGQNRLKNAIAAVKSLIDGQ